MLNNKVALITGGASGIGQATAVLFAKKGAKVVIADIDIDVKGRKLIEILKKKGRDRDIVFIKADISKESSVVNMVEETVRIYGQIDILFNNAGIYQDNSLNTLSSQQWNKIIDTNLKSAFLCSKYTTPYMKRMKSGCIINISSTSALRGEEEASAYCASKGGIISLTKAMARELIKYNIRVNCIIAGPIDTPSLRREMGVDERIELIKQIPLKRLGRPIDIAYGALFLSMDTSSYITGTSLIIDGGISLI
jgi:NAD(P)-dependent dehydrogenase (short-subunit alcohol dehydrogenase family)